MRKALLVGIDDYASASPLAACVTDVDRLEPLLARHDDDRPNFKCEKLTSAGLELVTCELLRRKLHEHLDTNFTGDVLFYFSGHGLATSLGGHLLTYEGSRYQPGFPMNELVRLANRSRAKNVFILLDCCYAGAAGSDEEVVGELENEAKLREGVTILAAARPRQTAREVGGHGIFTRLVLAALNGGAADVRGQVSAASVYAYAEAVLGALDQRPIYRSHAASLEPVRLCTPAVPDATLRRLPKLFPKPSSAFRLTPSYEKTHADAVHAHVEIYQALKSMQTARLLCCETGQDMYFTALASEVVSLTPLGRLYWELAISDQI